MKIKKKQIKSIIENIISKNNDYKEIRRNDVKQLEKYENDNIKLNNLIFNISDLDDYDFNDLIYEIELLIVAEHRAIIMYNLKRIYKGE